MGGGLCGVVPIALSLKPRQGAYEKHTSIVTIRLVLVIAVCMAFAATMPFRWGWRAGLGITAILGTILLLQPNIPFEDQGFFYGIWPSVLCAVLLAFCAGVILRWAISRSGGPIFRAQRNLPEYERNLLQIADRLLACVFGLCVGLFSVLAAAILMRGVAGGLPLHLGISACAALAALFIWRVCGGPACLIGATALITLSVMALLGGVLWPAMIKAKADQIMPGFPRCLRVEEQLATKAETMLFTLPQGSQLAPGLMLTIMEPKWQTDFRWSYRANRFVRYRYSKLGACPPERIP